MALNSSLKLSFRQTLPLLILAIGTGYIIIRAFAAGPAAFFLLANGTLTNGATVTANSAAIGGRMVVFGPAPTPIPTPTPTTACTPGIHVTGGSDSAGGCWPGLNNTGVPAGTTLTNYTGSCTITAAGTVINAKTVNCDLDIHAANVVIKNSKVNGLVFLDNDLAGSSQWSFTLQDSEVDGGTVQRAVLSTGNMTVLRANIHGGITSAQCDEKSTSCSVQNSWLHGQYIPNTANWHLGGFLSNGGSHMTLTHNTIVCDHAANSIGEGCTGDINFIPNFAAVSYATVDHNLLGANTGSAYCTYGGEKSGDPHANHLIYKNNVFQHGTNNKCASYGPVTDFDINGAGNQWIGNIWDNGATVPSG